MTVTTDQAPAETHVVDVRVGPQPAAPKPTAEPRRTTPPPATVHARPAAAFIGNAATIAGATVYAAAGATGLVAAGAAVAATGVAGVAAKGAANRRKTGSVWRSSSASPGGRAGSGLPKLGGGRSGTGGGSGSGAPGRKGGGLSGLLPSGSSAAPKKRVGTSAGSPGSGKSAIGGGKSGPGVGARFRKLFGGGSTGAGKAGSSTRPTGGGSTGTAAGKPSRAGGTARAFGRGLASPFRAIGNARHGLGKAQTGRQAAKAAREQAKQRAAARGAKRANWLRGWGSGMFALAAGGTRSGWRRLFGGKHAGGTPAAGAKAKTRGVREVAATVRRPGTAAAGDTKAPVPDAVPAPPQDLTAPTNNPVKSVNAGGAAMSRELYELSEQMVAAAARHQSDGMLEVGRDFNALPYIMANVAKATQMIVAKSAEEYPVHPAVIQALEMIHRTALATVQAAEQVNPAFERLHADELNRLRNPRRGEDKWDVRANRGAA